MPNYYNNHDYYCCLDHDALEKEIFDLNEVFSWLYKCQINKIKPCTFRQYSCTLMLHSQA